MPKTVNTSSGPARVGSLIRIDSLDARTTMLASFPDGVDHHALGMAGRTGRVTSIDDKGSLRGTWGTLAVLPDADTITVLEY